MNRRNLPLAASSITWGSWHHPASAQAWPDKSVRMLLSRKWNQLVVLESRPGGQNAIGSQAAAKLPADGFNFYRTTTATVVTNTYLFKTLHYDPPRDFTPVGMIGKVPFALTLNNTPPVGALKELVVYANANLTKVSLTEKGPKKCRLGRHRWADRQVSRDHPALQTRTERSTDRQGCCDSVAGHRPDHGGSRYAITVRGLSAGRTSAMGETVQEQRCPTVMKDH